MPPEGPSFHISIIMQSRNNGIGLVIILLGCISAMRIFAQEPAPSGVLPEASPPFSETVLLSLPPSDGPLVVQAGFQLHDINMIDDQSETFEFSGILTLRWKDPRQAFDPAVEGVKEKFYQGNYQFNELAPAWYPEVALMNVAGMVEKKGLLFRVRPDGTCTLVEGINAVAKSKLQLRRFPFDRQHLQAMFAVMGYSRDEVVMEVLPIPSIDPEKIRVPQWHFEHAESRIVEADVAFQEGESGPSMFVFEMELKRQFMFVMRLVIMPLFLVVILSWSVFWMDRASIGDRMSVSFVGLLTVVAYQIVLGDILPHISYLTLTNVFVNFSFMLMCATIVVNLFVGEFDRSGRGEASNRLDLRCRWIFPLVYGILIIITTTLCFLFSR